ncbi:MAG: helix-turn-helix domain-containing protein [bacterium]
MDQRIRFVSEYLNAYFSFTELCNQFEISRKTGYKWIGRYKGFGPLGLEDQSRKPHDCPHKTDKNIINAIRNIRQKHPHWGPKKFLIRLGIKHPNWLFPAISTTADILKREGLILPGKRRLKRKHPGCPKTTAEQSNDIMNIIIHPTMKLDE